MRLFNKTKFNFLNKRKIAMYISIVLIFLGVVSLIKKGGPNLSIDFKGGAIIQIKFEKPIDIVTLRSIMEKNNFKISDIIEFGSPDEFLLKGKIIDSSEEFLNSIKSTLGEMQYEIRRLETVGPKIGKELRTSAIYAILMALVGILFYIWFRFDRFYALGSVAALIHDVLVTLGLFSIFNFEIDLTIVAAFLTIVGYSLNDTIVVFDRIRENIGKYSRENLDSVVNLSLNETLNRTIITSMTTLIVVLTLFFVGGEVIKLFAFALIIGVLVGTYSSIYVASPVMIYFENRVGQKLKK